MSTPRRVEAQPIHIPRRTWTPVPIGTPSTWRTLGNFNATTFSAGTLNGQVYYARGNGNGPPAIIATTAPFASGPGICHLGLQDGETEAVWWIYYDSATAGDFLRGIVEADQNANAPSLDEQGSIFFPAATGAGLTDGHSSVAVTGGAGATTLLAANRQRKLLWVGTLTANCDLILGYGFAATAADGFPMPGSARGCSLEVTDGLNIRAALTVYASANCTVFYGEGR